jgi:large subunit ribosomal protein L49
MIFTSFTLKTIYKGIFQPVANSTVKGFSSLSSNATHTSNANDERKRRQQLLHHNIHTASITAHQLNAQQHRKPDNHSTPALVIPQIPSSSSASSSSSNDKKSISTSTKHTQQQQQHEFQHDTPIETHSSTSTSASTPIARKVGFHIQRTASHQLPVYTNYRNAGSRIITILRKYSGNEYELLREVRSELGPDAIVDARQGKIIVDGQYSKQLKEWLERLGF